MSEVAVPWCSGYHVSLTHSRSWVRSPAEPLSVFLWFLDKIIHVQLTTKHINNYCMIIGEVSKFVRSGSVV